MTTLIFFVLLILGCSKETRELFRNRKEPSGLKYPAATTGDSRVVNLIRRVKVGS